MPQPVNISASRGAAILGLLSWKTPREAWLEIMEEREPGFCDKNNYALPEKPDNAAMRWGTAFESAIIDIAEKKSDYEINNREKFFSHKKHNFITCHIDGEYPASAIHEGKTTNEWTFRESYGEPGTDQVPVEYQIQCQHQIICTGADQDIMSVLVFPKRPEEFEEMGYYIDKLSSTFYLCHKDVNAEYGNIKDWAFTIFEMGYFHQFIIKPNPELQKKMIAHYTDFWKNNILKKIPPEPRNIDDIKMLVRDPIGSVISTPEIRAIINEMRDIQKEIGNGGSLKKRIDQIKTDVMNFILSSEKITDDDSRDKFILRDTDGKKLISYYKDKNGTFILR